MGGFDAKVVQGRLESARKNLIDISLRNKLINYRPSRASGLTFVNEEPEQVYRHLVTNGSSLTFSGKPDPKKLTTTANKLGSGELDLDDEESEELFRAQAEAELDQAIDFPELTVDSLDKVLSTNEIEPVLKTKLLKTYRDAHLVIEEQGINVLFIALGMLTWYEADYSEEKHYAPLLFIPVEIERDKRGHFKIKYDGTEIGSNLSLAAKLQEFDITWPDLPVDADDIDTKAYFQKARKSIKDKHNWEIDEKSVVLGLFSYAKYMMYKDLDAAAWQKDQKPADHNILGALLDSGFGDDEPSIGEDECVDPYRPIEQINEVYEADSSQVLAILEANTGRSMIIEGPPGTGKSQTITNLIAEAVGNGRKVLFVAEKMAALEVVARRLRAAEIGDACLELHSNKANKRAFYEELKRTMELGAPKLLQLDIQMEQLEKTRSHLNSYCEELNTLIDKRAITPFEAIGTLVEMGPEPTAEARVPAEEMAGWTGEDLRRKLPIVERLQAFVSAHGIQSENPFFGSKLTLFMPADRVDLLEALQVARSSVQRLLDSAEELCSTLGIPMPQRVSDVRAACSCARRALDAPQLDGVTVSTHEWIANRSQLESAIEKGARLSGLRNRRETELTANAWSTDVARFHESLAKHGSKLLRFLNADYRKAIRSSRALFRQGRGRPLSELLSAIDSITECQQLTSCLEDLAPLCQRTFGVQWQDESSDWNVLFRVLEWVAELHERVASGELPVGLLAFFDGSHDSKALRASVDAVLRLLDDSHVTFTKALGLLKYSAEIGDDIPSILSKLDRWISEIDELNIAIHFNHLRDEATAAGLVTPARLAESWAQAGDLLTERVRRSFYNMVLREAFSSRPMLRAFDRVTHEKVVEEFRNLDSLMQRYNRVKVSRRHFQAVPRRSGHGTLGWLQTQFERKRNHKAIRTAMKTAGDAIQAIKPVFMMSPLSVAMYLPPDGPKFDLVIFDEASQVKPEDAFGAVLRAKQVVVVGDSMQMPPTSFFDKVTGYEDEPEEDDEAVEDRSVVNDMESILKLMGTKLGSRKQWLRWHYRSKHDSLIAFANRAFYEDKLVIFPNPVRQGDGKGVLLHYLPDTIYQRGGSRKNILEARAVAAAIRDHVHNCRDLSLGVAAFSVAQQQAIEDELELVRKGDSAFEIFSQRHPLEPLFIKNLENVQGDERDVIFISVGYGKDEDRKVSMGFGPLNRDGGHRRLNVLITRARERCEVFTNLHSSDFNLSGSSSRGVKAFKDYLYFCETGRLDPPSVSGHSEDSPFESAVLSFLRQSGYEAEPQIGTAGFFVDIGVINPNRPGAFALGIECDGATYHSAKSARDRDKLREMVLRDRGWRLHRIWSTDWFHNREREERRLLEAVQRAFDSDNSAGPPAATEPPPILPVVQRDGNGNGSAARRLPPYLKANVPINLGSKELHEVDPGLLANAVVQIATLEAPIHVEEVVKRIRDGAGLYKAGMRIRYAVDQAIRVAVTQRGLLLKDGFLYIRGNKGVPLRDRSNFDSGKKLDYVCDEEISEAIRIIVRDSYGIEPVEACACAIRLLGFDRETAQMKRRVGKILDSQLKSGQLRLDGSVIKDCMHS